MVTPYSMSENAPNEAYCQRLAYNATPDIVYIGLAKSIQREYTYSIAAATITNIVVLTNVGTVTAPTHGLIVNNRVTLAGWTVDTDLNDTYVIQTVADANTFTITTASVANATYVDAAGTFTTTAPRSSAPVWAIKKLTYSGTDPVAAQWAEGVSSETQIYDNRASLAYA
jgi:hypothetical protein